MASRLQETGRVNQAEAAQIIGMSSRAFRDFEKRVGLEPDDVDGNEKLYRAFDVYSARFSEQMGTTQKAGRVLPDEDGEDIDVDLERARKLKAERIKTELENARTTGELAPLDLMRSALRDALQTVNQFLESVPAIIKRANPEISGSALDKVESDCAKVRNSIADGRINYTDERLAEHRREPRLGDEGDA